MRDFNPLWNSTASYFVVKISCYYLNLLLFTCYTLSSVRDAQENPRLPSEHRSCGTAELLNSSGQGTALQSVLGTASPSGFLLSQCHFTWLIIYPGKAIWITGTWKADMQGLFTEWKGSNSGVWVWSCFLFFYYNRIIFRKTEMNMVHASVKTRKNVISLWLLRVKVSLSFNYYILGSHFISSSQFRKPFKHVLNFSQEFRLQWYSGVHKALLAEMGCMCWTGISVCFNLTCVFYVLSYMSVPSSAYHSSTSLATTSVEACALPC